MDSKINEQGILEFKGLTMNRALFKQLVRLTASAPYDQVAGWVYEEACGFLGLVVTINHGQGLGFMPRMEYLEKVRPTYNAVGVQLYREFLDEAEKAVMTTYPQVFLR